MKKLFHIIPEPRPVPELDLQPEPELVPEPKSKPIGYLNFFEILFEAKLSSRKY